jgi:predicted NAD/FAD-binding protein
LTTDDRPRVAVVGAGVSGLTAAYLLRRSHRVTLFEQEDRLGGHAHTHDVETGTTGTTGTTGEDPVPVDSGFIVLNDRTYPLVGRLFAELGVHLRATEMSMGISCGGCGLGFVGGRGASGIFAQRRRVADASFWRLLLGVRRFQRAALAQVRDAPDSLETYGGFLERLAFRRSFVQHYALPIVACVWSSGHQDAIDYPASYLFAFLSHHGFLTQGDAPQWYVVEGGSRTYVDALQRHLDDVRSSDRVSSVARRADRVVVTDGAGAELDFDRVVVATHADEALALLSDPSRDESDVLGAFRYSANATQLHTDDSVLPAHNRERASWNFHLTDCDAHSDSVQVTYWMNRLQHHADSSPLLVTLNGSDVVDRAHVVAEMAYTHPVFSPASVRAQRRLGSLQTTTTAYAGAYHGWGFHEDGCRSGVAAAAHFGATW